MPEMPKPNANVRPERKETRADFIRSSQEVIAEVHYYRAAGDEGCRCDYRSRREPTDAAYPVPAGASVAESGAEADQEPRGG